MRRSEKSGASVAHRASTESGLYAPAPVDPSTDDHAVRVQAILRRGRVGPVEIGQMSTAGVPIQPRSAPLRGPLLGWARHCWYPGCSTSLDPSGKRRACLHGAAIVFVHWGPNFSVCRATGPVPPFKTTLVTTVLCTSSPRILAVGGWRAWHRGVGDPVGKRVVVAQVRGAVWNVQRLTLNNGSVGPVERVFA